MEEAPENGKESSHSAYAKGMNERMLGLCCVMNSYTRIEIVYQITCQAGQSGV